MYLNFPYLVTLSSVQFLEILLSDKLSIFAYEKKRLCTYECQASGGGSFLFKKAFNVFFFFKKLKKDLNVLRYANLPVKVGL